METQIGHEIEELRHFEAIASGFFLEEPKGLRSMDFEDILNTEIIEKPLIRGFLAKDDPMIVHAPGGVGKSILIQDISMSVGAKVEKLFGIFPIEADCFSLFIQSENSMSQTKERISLKCKGNPAFLRGLQNLHCVLGREGDPRFTGIAKDPAFQQNIIELCSRLEDENLRPVDIIVWDPLISYHQDEENDSGMRGALDSILTIALRIGATPIVLHHDNRRGEIRGSSAISDWARSIIRIEDATYRGEKRIKLTHEKSNNSKPFEPFVLKMDQFLNFEYMEDEGHAPTRADADRSAKVFESLKLLGGNVTDKVLLIEQYRELSGVKAPTTIQRHIDKAVTNGIINRSYYMDGNVKKARYTI